MGYASDCLACNYCIINYFHYLSERPDICQAIHLSYDLNLHFSSEQGTCKLFILLLLLHVEGINWHPNSC